MYPVTTGRAARVGPTAGPVTLMSTLASRQSRQHVVERLHSPGPAPCFWGPQCRVRMIRALQHNTSRGDRYCLPAISPTPVLICAIATPSHAVAHPEPERPHMTTANTFADLGVPAPLVQALTAAGRTSPFPIQAATLPDTLAGRDVLGRGKTGSGKTLAFSIPLVARLSNNKRRPVSPGRSGAGSHPGTGHPDHRRTPTSRCRLRPAGDDDLRRGSARSPGAGPQRRRRHRGCLPRTARGPDAPAAHPPRRCRGHGDRRSRPHGRPRVPARRHPDSGRHTRPAASVCCSRPPWTMGSTNLCTRFLNERGVRIRWTRTTPRSRR